MNTKNESDGMIPRRKFLQRSAGMFGAVVLLAEGTPCGAHPRPFGEWHGDDIIRLNPAFHLREVDTGVIELTTHLPGGALLSHRFEGLEANVLTLAQAGRDSRYITMTLADRHGQPHEEVTRRVTLALEEFAAAGLVYAGDPIFVKIQRRHG